MNLKVIKEIKLIESNVDNDYGVLIRILGVMKAVLLFAKGSSKLLFSRNQHRP